jgi:triosephosphate isomerase
MNRKYRRTVIAANWKMNLLASQVRAFADDLKQRAGSARWCDIVVCPSYALIPAAQKAFRDTRVAVGAQDMSIHESGAYTGEVSAAQLEDIDVQYVIIGHSERRRYFGESDLDVNTKVLAALARNLRPIVCVGESLTEREMGITTERVTLQVKTALSGVPASKMRRILIAYEPIWAIGTGKTASAADAAAVAEAIRGLIRTLYGARTARAVSILYGGSMNPANARELLAQPDIDGGLIGGASLSSADFAAIIAAANPENY